MHAALRHYISAACTTRFVSPDELHQRGNPGFEGHPLPLYAVLCKRQILPRSHLLTCSLSVGLLCDLLWRMSDSHAEDSKDVLEKVKADGTFDEMRLRVTETVKKSVGCPATVCWPVLL